MNIFTRFTILLCCCTSIINHSLHAQQVFNGGMEDWHHYTINSVAMEAPDGWNGLDSLVGTWPYGTVQHVFQSTDAHSGNYAAMMVSLPHDTTIGVIAGCIINGEVNHDTSVLAVYVGGTPVTSRIYSVSAWVKYQPAGNDQMSFSAAAVIAGAGAGGLDSLVGLGILYPTQLDTYTKVTVPIFYVDNYVVPTHIQISFCSSTITINGSTLWVDDVTLDNSTNSVSATPSGTDAITLSPNPVSDVLVVRAKDLRTRTWKAYDSNGRIIATASFSGTVSINLSDKAPGIYCYRIFDADNTPVQSGTFVISH